MAKADNAYDLLRIPLDAVEEVVFEFDHAYCCKTTESTCDKSEAEEPIVGCSGLVAVLGPATMQACLDEFVVKSNFKFKKIEYSHLAEHVSVKDHATANLQVLSSFVRSLNVLNNGCAILPLSLIHISEPTRPY